MKYLFLDTSSSYINISVIINEEIKATIKKENNRTLSENIFIYLKEVLTKAQIELKKIDKIFVTIGPGSFTGTRVGITIAKTTAWALNIPVVPISTLQLYATTKAETPYLIPYIVDRNGYVYAGIYNNQLEEQEKDQYIQVDKLLKNKNKNDYTLIGHEEITTNLKTIKPQIELLSIINKQENNIIENVHHLKPNYLKIIEAERKHD